MSRATRSPIPFTVLGNNQQHQHQVDTGTDNEAQVNDNDAAPTAVVADDGLAVDNPATAANEAAVATDSAWPVDNNNANAWNNGGETAGNNDNYSATAGAGGNYGGGQGARRVVNDANRNLDLGGVSSAASFTFLHINFYSHPSLFSLLVPFRRHLSHRPHRSHPSHHQ